MKGWAIFRMFSSYAQQGRRRYRVGEEITQLQHQSVSVATPEQTAQLTKCFVEKRLQFC